MWGWLFAACIIALFLFFYYHQQCYYKTSHEVLFQKGTNHADTPYIIISGNSGSGKSTLAKELAALFHLHYIDIDHHRFLPAEKGHVWKNREMQDFSKQVLNEIEKVKNQHSIQQYSSMDPPSQREISKNGWVVDGNVMNMDILISSHASIVLWLDYSWVVVLLRLIVRTTKRILFKTRVCNGNIETWYNQLCSKDSLLLFTLKRFWNWKEHESRVVNWIKSNPHLTVYRFQSPHECKMFLTYNLPKMISINK
ncbi:hypothetical protein FDP41_006386 [Naegleria fowleri]|uniref:(d)CMP kinase n=1 Tax=Naegleria fowleri TaxID=5763 RepID=A0A6A5BJY6_NAEFO|nr:uncharacterized protein FDP41_006386 [Naegleria fowleri]KAF0974354.1 hypothetical protein FDP41_006386 [Naegleria fowleri]CAG4719608.1 unnamed protein product [Naegleria fowleri]